MAIQVEDGVDWSGVIDRIERLPRGESRIVSFIGTGKSMTVEHHEDGVVRLRIDGDGDAQWIYPRDLKMLAAILRRGFEQRARA